MTNLPAKPVTSTIPMMDPGSFEHMQRVGKMLAMSPLFPEHLRKPNMETAIANGVLVVNMAIRQSEDPLTVAQNIYFVSGKPGWSSSYMIGKANQHGVFKNPISWDIKGEGDTLSVTSFAELTDTGKRVSATCDMAMAKAENWTKNSKYQSMPEQMLRYRSATFLIRLYCPEVMIGVPAQIEVELGMKDITPDDYSHVVKEAPAKAEPKTEDAELIEDAEPEPKTEKKAEKETKEATEKPAADQEEKPKEEKAEPPAETKVDGPAADQLAQMADMIQRDLTGEYPVQDVLESYAIHIENIKNHAPEIYKKLEEQIDAVRKSQT